ncbi:hypothetical protein ACFLQ8_02290 [Candidatus Auribacterota bacterium]
MTRFEKKYFREFKFAPGDIEQYLNNAVHDLKIAGEDPFPEVMFSYSYQALIKTGIVLIAVYGKVKVRSVPGHHIRILEKMSEILNDPDVVAVGNSMRMKRNTDFYGGGIYISKKEAKEYYRFVEAVLAKVNEKLRKE